MDAEAFPAFCALRASPLSPHPHPEAAAVPGAEEAGIAGGRGAAVPRKGVDKVIHPPVTGLPLKVAAVGARVFHPPPPGKRKRLGKGIYHGAIVLGRRCGPGRFGREKLRRLLHMLHNRHSKRTSFLAAAAENAEAESVEQA